MPAVQVVVVTYNNVDDARECVGSLCSDSRLDVTVVDNDSDDGTADSLQGLPIRLIRSGRNGGFAVGCNIGWRSGTAPNVLFLNPDARISPDDVVALAGLVESQPLVGAIGPRILESDGSLQFSQRSFPTIRASFARAFFLHRLFPKTALSFDVTDPAAYDERSFPNWLSGACLLVRREILELLDGFDERFFMYCEDMDICRRIRAAGYTVMYEPSVIVEHQGAASAPRARMIPLMTRSRLRYAAKHRSGVAYWFERMAIALDNLTHAALTTQGREARWNYLKSAGLSLTGR